MIAPDSGPGMPGCAPDDVAVADYLRLLWPSDPDDCPGWSTAIPSRALLFPGRPGCAGR